MTRVTRSLLKERAIAPQEMSDEDFAKLGSEQEDSLAIQALDGVVWTAEKYDSVTGAPLRAAISAAQNAENPFKAAYKQFGEDPSTAPTGQDIVEKTGIVDKGSTSAKLLGFAADIAIDPLTLASSAVRIPSAIMRSFSATEKLLLSAKTAGRESLVLKSGINAFKAVAQNSTLKSVQKIMAKKGEGVIGRALIDSGLSPLLNKPKELLDKISGAEKYNFNYQRTGDGIIQHVTREASREGSGVISNISDTTEKLIELSQEAGATPTNLSKMGDDLLERFTAKMKDPTSGIEYSEEVIKKYAETYQNLVIKQDPAVFKRTGSIKGLPKVGMPGELEKGVWREVGDVQALKKGIGKQISDAQFKAGASPADDIKLEVLRDIYDGLNEAIAKSVDGIVGVDKSGKALPMGFMVQKNNADVSALMDVADMLSRTKSEVLLKNSKMQSLMSAGAAAIVGAGTVGAGLINPTTALIVGGGATAFKESKNISRMLPAIVSRAQESILSGKALKNVTHGGQASRGLKLTGKAIEKNRPLLTGRKDKKK